LASYLGLLAAPVHLQTQRQLLSGNPACLHALTAAGVVALVGLLALAAWGWRKRPVVCFGVMWFMITLVPMLGVIPLNATLAEHWVYVPSVGLYLVVAALLVPSQGRQQWFWVGLGVVVAALTARTMLRNTDWANPATFYAATKKAAPDNTAARVNLSRTYADNAQDDLALAELRGAEQVDPTSASVKCRLAALYYFKGQYPNAQQKIEEALRLSPDNTTALLLAAETAEQLHDLRLAERYFAKALATTLTPQARVRYVEFLMRQRKLAPALAVMRETVEQEPGDAELHNRLGVVLAEMGRSADAEQAFVTARKLDRHAPDAWINLARLAAYRGNDASAARLFEEALDRAPDNLPALYQLALIHCKLGQKSLAEEELNHAQRVAPNNPQVRAAREALQRGAPCPAISGFAGPDADSASRSRQ
jgi:Flp pilus assembly protein TadD